MSRSADFGSQIFARVFMIDQLREMNVKEQRQRMLKQMADLLENDKYKEVPFGAQSLITLILY